ncbi:MAG: hypothetical protein R2724_02325 [Bryobacterales bacterium]
MPNAFALGFSTSGSFSSPDNGVTQALQLSSGDAGYRTRSSGFQLPERCRWGPPVVSASYIEPNHRNAMAQQWNFGVQKQLPGNFLVEATYIANMGHRLGGAPVNWNQTPLVNGQGPVKANRQEQPVPAVHRRQPADAPDWGNSSYHSGNLKVENALLRRLQHDLQLHLGEVPRRHRGRFGACRTGGQRLPTPLATSPQRSYSGSDIRHRVAFSAVYELPFGRGRKFDINNKALNAIVGGWGFGIISELHTGSPFSVLENTNLSNTFSPSQRSNIDGPYPKDAALGETTSRVRHSLTLPSSLRPAGIFGTAPRSFLLRTGHRQLRPPRSTSGSTSPKLRCSSAVISTTQPIRRSSPTPARLGAMTASDSGSSRRSRPVRRTRFAAFTASQF